MTTLREAAQQALEAMEIAEVDPHSSDAVYKAIEALRAVLAEPVQEPAAWRYKPMVGSPWSLSDDGYYISCKRDKDYIIEPLYTAPPQRKPLTEEKMRECAQAMDAEPLAEGWHELIKFARAIERAHGIGGKDEP